MWEVLTQIPLHIIPTVSKNLHFSFYRQWLSDEKSLGMSCRMCVCYCLVSGICYCYLKKSSEFHSIRIVGFLFRWEPEADRICYLETCLTANCGQPETLSDTYKWSRIKIIRIKRRKCPFCSLVGRTKFWFPIKQFCTNHYWEWKSWRPFLALHLFQAENGMALHCHEHHDMRLFKNRNRLNLSPSIRCRMLWGHCYRYQFYWVHLVYLGQL